MFAGAERAVPLDGGLGGEGFLSGDGEGDGDDAAAELVGDDAHAALRQIDHATEIAPHVVEAIACVSAAIAIAFLTATHTEVISGGIREG